MIPQRITKENIGDMIALMREDNAKMIAYGKEHPFDPGGFLGSMAQLMGDPEVLDGLEELLQPLLEYERVFFVRVPTFEYEGRTFSVKTMKERSPQKMVERFEEELKQGRTLFIKEALWQKPHEFLEQKYDGYAVTRFASVVM